MSHTAKAQTKTSERSLPEGWQWVKFGDVIAESQPGFASGQRDPKGVIQLRMNNVDTRGNLVWEEFLRVPAEDAAIERYSLKPGDIVFNNTNSTELVGKSALFLVRDEPIVYSNHFTRLRVKPDLADPGFVTFWLISQWQAKTFANICNRWIGQSAVKTDKLFTLEIPLPPLDEQRRIAKRLNEQLVAVELARKAAEEQLQAARQLPSAYLREVFEGEEAKRWEGRKISELCRRIDYGYTASANFGIREPKFLRITDIQDGKVNWDQVPGCKIHSNEERNNLLSDGDIVFARTGATTGKSFLIRKPPRAVFASYLIRLQHNDEVTADYLYAFFQSDSYWQQIRENARGAAQPNVNATLLGQITLPVAPLREQERIISAINDKLAEIGKMTYAIESQLAEINSLSASLLREGFRGEI